MVLDRLGEVVEAVAAAEVGDGRAAHRLARAVDEAADLLQQLGVQVLLVAADGRGGDVHARVPVDLVQPQRRPLPELAVDGRDDAVGDQVGGRWSRPSASRACQATISGQAISVSTTRCWMPLLAADAVLPAGLVALGAGAGLRDPRRALAQRVDQRPRAVVAARRAGVAGERRRGVREQQVRAQHRALGRVGVAVPVAVELILHAVGERPVGGVVERAPGRAASGLRQGSPRAASAGLRAARSSPA